MYIDMYLHIETIEQLSPFEALSGIANVDTLCQEYAKIDAQEIC